LCNSELPTAAPAFATPNVSFFRDSRRQVIVAGMEVKVLLHGAQKSHEKWRNTFWSIPPTRPAGLPPVKSAQMTGPGATLNPVAG